MGARTRVRVARSGASGTVRFVGEAPALGPGAWLGLELDDGGGKHDGEVKGTRLFTCAAGRGCVLRPGGARRLDDDAVADAAVAGAGPAVPAADAGGQGEASSIFQAAEAAAEVAGHDAEEDEESEDEI